MIEVRELGEDVGVVVTKMTSWVKIVEVGRHKV
jgi:hypothetical protein